ncbi:flagellar basal body-associated protein FliL [Ewingella sp. S1.OA.A_B6]
MSDSAISTKRKSKRPMLIILLVLVTLAACAAGGYAWWMLHNKTATSGSEQVKKNVPPAPPIFLALDTFTVNLQNADNNPDRVLYIGLTLRLSDQQNRTMLGEYLPEVRSRLLLLLSRQKSDDLASENGKQQLIAEIKQVLSTPFVKGQPSLVINDVLFTAFILR